MAIAKAPGIEVIEGEKGARVIEGIFPSIAAVVGITEKGKIGEPILVTSYPDFVNKFGTKVGYSYTPFSVQHFFDNGGTMLYVVRTCHYSEGTPTAVSSDVTVPDSGSVPDDCLAVEAHSEGTWGDLITFSIEYSNKLSTKLAEDASNGDDYIIVEDINGAQVGRAIKIGDGGTEEYGKIKSIDETNRKIYLETPLSGDYNAEDPVVSLDFNITVYYKGVQVEPTWEYLSMESDCAGYVENVLNDDNSGSKYVRVTEISSASDYPTKLPAVGQYALSGGDNGLTGMTQEDFYDLEEEEGGIYALKKVVEPLTLFVPDIHLFANPERAHKAIEQWAEQDGRVAFIYSPPYGYNQQNAREYKRTTAMMTSKYSAGYYPWQKFYDTVRECESYIPPEGMVVGTMVRMDRQKGINRAPAGTSAQLVDSLGPERELSKQDLEYLSADLNCIIKKPGYGILVWGCRTSTNGSQSRYINNRRYLNYLKVTLQQGMQYIVFNPANKTETYIQGSLTLESFLRAEWREGRLVGNTAQDAFYVNWTGSVNPKELTDRGIMTFEIGVSLEVPGEFVRFIVYPGTGGAVEEI